MFIIVCSVIVQHKNKFLFVLETKDEARGKLGLPGGQLDPLEPIESCARRELLEETGLMVKAIQPVGVVHKPMTQFGNNVIKFVFHANVSSEKLPVSSELECRWLTAEEVRALNRQNKIRGADVTALIDALPIKELTVLTY